MKKNVLITGGAGFIGSNYINYISEDSDLQIINLDKLTYAADLSNIKIENNKNYTFIEGDICDIGIVEDIFKKYKIDTVVHFAAESHVDNSITGPKQFIDTNIVGTFNVLQQAYQTWMSSPNEIKPKFKHARFLHISTDEVYGTLGKTGLFTEKTPYAPNSPYSASKASSDMLVRSYFHTYGLPVVTTNCSNNYGPRQHDEKLIPTIIRKAIKEESIPIYGTGKNIRDWLYVLDHCKGIDLVLNSGKKGETYNIGGKNEKENIYIATIICEILDTMIPRSNDKSYKDLITFVKDRPGHDYRYAIDATKIENELGWTAEENFESGIKKTVTWYLEKYTI
ncbi:dTDP-glucose 4,6-dehydratase [Aquimarina muelleri]|uniref:dTDP-glucose 4,6-dehydratase n=1 Tax=Aquimarina muelleri TaxID=279356 RepID=A0A918JVY5_9FLAO|nr:dTDP-glucose 4,6-dehydratase [Aquimarina muelleri]MCX2764202.1 dTDP-glucose 4,6-dehydratase [Aquimarina muelleri]GGX19568.1 dTDP-glucose 4,6-dehydratase [Aquimarina muelleri]